MLYVVIIASVFGAIVQYLDKYLVNLGISRKDYFYYTCLSMIPFSLIMVIIEYATNQLRFSFNIIPIILLGLAMFFRYKKQNTIVGCLKYLNPYEDSSYLTLVLVSAYIIDILLGIESITCVTIISLILTIFGVFLLANNKLKTKDLQHDVITRIIMILLINYTVHYILKYWSNALFLLLLNLFLTILFSKKYNFDYHIQHIKIIKWVLIQQCFGFISLYLCNYLTSNSVTLSSYVRPMTIVFIVIISIFYKDVNKRPNLKQIASIILIVLGVFLI